MCSELLEFDNLNPSLLGKIVAGANALLLAIFTVVGKILSNGKQQQRLLL